MRSGVELIDSHCHLDLPAFDADREQVLARCAALGVGHIVVPAIAAAGWQRLAGLCDCHPGLSPAYGLHPMFMQQHRLCPDATAGPGDVERLEGWLQQHRAVALGEIGLDFWDKRADRGAQTALFEQQLAVAARQQLPVLLHVRKAHDQVLNLLQRHRPPGGIAHAFNGSLQQAQRYIDLGFCLGFGGMLTFARSRKLRALAAALPLHALVLETDAPDMTVAAHRGERNSPEYLPDVAIALAQLRDGTLAEVADATTANARRVLGLG